MRLDPRTKLLILAVTSVSVFVNKSIAVECVLAGIPLVLLSVSGNLKRMLKYAAFFLALLLIQLFIVPRLPVTFGGIVYMFAVYIRKLLPCFILGSFLIATTSVSRFLAAITKLRLSKGLTIALAVTLRYFPTMREEWASIRDAMALRGISASAAGLISHPIRENIRIGKPEATDAEIEAAAKKASCHDFIAALPEGYDTLAGDAGNHLSGGERQRIAIARAILKNSPIVVLDEATAFTDPENEAVIQASIAGLVAGKTLIVIAHRLSTITKADKILVVDKGNVVAEGTHEELLETSNLYKELWRAHMQGKDTAEEVV